MAVWKFWLDVFGEMVGVWGGLVILQSFLTIIKDSSPFNFQLNELFSKFLRQQMAISKLVSAFREKYEKWGGGYPNSDHSESQKEL